MPPSPPPATRPIPTAATFSAGTDVLTVTFDQALVPGTSDEENWELRHGGNGWETDGEPIIAGSTVTADMVVVGLAPGTSVCSYAHFPPDVVALVGGLTADAFADFPVTIIP